MGTEVGLTRPSEVVAASALELVQHLVDLTVSGSLVWAPTVIEDYKSPLHLLAEACPQVTYRAVAGGVTFSLACARGKAHPTAGGCHRDTDHQLRRGNLA